MFEQNYGGIMEELDLELLEDFKLESLEFLDNAEEDLLDFEDNPNPDKIDRIMRSFHTIKGNSGMLGFNEIVELAHKSEDLFIDIKKKQLALTSDITNLILKIVDILRKQIEEINTDRQSDFNIEEILKKLQNLHNNPTGETPQKTNKPQNITKEKIAGKKLNFLVTEDDFTSRKLLSILLSKFGKVDVAMNGKEALSAYIESVENVEFDQYDMICMDIMMPEMDGLEATKLIRDFEERNNFTYVNEVKIVMTTALDDPKTVIKSLYKCRANSYLVKPITPQTLQKELKKCSLIS